MASISKVQASVAFPALADESVVQDTDPTIPNNKHLTRLVRFSILQARRSSQASKAVQSKDEEQKVRIIDSKEVKNEAAPEVFKKSDPPGGKPQLQIVTTADFVDPVKTNSELDPTFSRDKERPRVEYPCEYDAPGRVVDISGDPPVMEDISASLTMSGEEQSNYTFSYEEGAVPVEDMDLLLAPDSGLHGMATPNSNSSQEAYNSAEMYSSSGNYYDNASQDSDMTDGSSDSIMRRVEQEIENARKASSDAQARLAYFSSGQTKVPFVTADSYSFDFHSLETNGNLQDMLDVGEDEDDLEPQEEPATDEHFESAMSVIDQEFDTALPELPPMPEVGEKVDIEVVLAPHPPSSYPRRGAKARGNDCSSPRMQQISPLASPNMRASPTYRVGHSPSYRSPRHLRNETNEQDIPAVFSEQSIDSLPTQANIERPGSFSFQDGSNAESDLPRSPAKKTHNMLPPLAHTRSREREGRLRLTVDVNEEDKQINYGNASTSPTRSVLSPTQASRLPSTPREPSTPSYRERLENKLKILGSRYPVSPAKSMRTPTSKEQEGKEPVLEADEGVEAYDALAKHEHGQHQEKRAKKSPSDASSKALHNPGNNLVLTKVTSPLEQTYDGLESRIKHLLARTLNPSFMAAPVNETRNTNQTPSEELKAIKKLLEQGVVVTDETEAKHNPQETKILAVGASKEQKADSGNSREETTEDSNIPVMNKAKVNTKEEEIDAKQPRNSVQATNSDATVNVEEDDPTEISEVSQSPMLNTPTVTWHQNEMVEMKPDKISHSAETHVEAEAEPHFSGQSEPEAEPQPELEPQPQPQPQTGPEPESEPEPKPEPQSESQLEQQSSEPRIEHKLEQDLILGSNADESITNSDSVSLDDDFEDISEVESQSNDDDDWESLDEVESHLATGEEKTDPISDTVSDSFVKGSTSEEILGDLDDLAQTSDFKARLSLSSRIDGQSEDEPTGSPQNSEAVQLTPPNPVERREDSKQTSCNHNAALVNEGHFISPNPSNDTWVPPVLSPKRHDQEESASAVQSLKAASNNDASQGRPSSTEDTYPQSPVKKTQSALNALNAALARPSLSGAESRSRQPLSPSSAVDHASLQPAEGSMSPSAAGNEGNSDKWVSNDMCSQSEVGREALSSNAVQGQNSAENRPPLSAKSEKNSSRSRVHDKQVLIQDAAKKRLGHEHDKKIRFRDPYPTPKPCRKPRSTEDIKRDHLCQPTQSECKLRWKEPKEDLQRLLDAATDPSLARRSNACGALKVISKQEKNRVPLVRTIGFLDALVFIAGADTSLGETEVKQEARARAISCIYNLSTMKENRYLICSHPGLLDCLVTTIKEDRGMARSEACGILAQLAKSPSCREYMASVGGLLSSLATVLNWTRTLEKTIDSLSGDMSDEALSSSYSDESSFLSDQLSSETGRSPKAERRDGLEEQYHDTARLNACAALVHLSKQCTILEHFCSNKTVLACIIEVARDFDCSLHGKCLEILCNLSRLPANNATMTRFPGVFDALLGAGSSNDVLDRVWALRTLQNMSSDASSKATLATSTLLTLLINCVTSKGMDEQHAAMATLLNLSTDPSAVVPITSTKNVLATLVYLAHNAESTSEIRLMACNALATVGLWLQTVSGFGTIPDHINQVLLPSHKTTGWEIWE